MLDFLMLSGQIDKRDGLLATWFHRANSKDEMNKALASKLTWTTKSIFVHTVHTHNRASRWYGVQLEIIVILIYCCDLL
ncbi:unnamed protein product [Tetraodon nigroviridis]|uniref:(spotted green pufferfish) hypothetical protein n=1 Tax=Tetraodon nigroviridis TaxID=99883 RepID=Q4SRR3_TETNG|nr:unnamed protein product [Tetraodon nigroviridis]